MTKIETTLKKLDDWVTLLLRVTVWSLMLTYFVIRILPTIIVRVLQP